MYEPNHLVVGKDPLPVCQSLSNDHYQDRDPYRDTHTEVGRDPYKDTPIGCT